MSTEKIINLSYLNELTGGEPEILKEFIQLFIEQIPEFRDGLQKFLNEKKYDELGELAHKAKSSVLTFGMEELGVQLKKLQLKTQVLEDVDSYPEFVRMFTEQIDQAEKELQEELQRL
jgi:HPt (histidine-containing phosphotransfer) domain-containing protein